MGVDAETSEIIVEMRMKYSSSTNLFLGTLILWTEIVTIKNNSSNLCSYDVLSDEIYKSETSETEIIRTLPTLMFVGSAVLNKAKQCMLELMHDFLVEISVGYMF